MKIFSEGRIAGLTLKNRVIRSGCFEGMCPGGRPSVELLEHHRSLAAGGIAMTTVAYCSVSQEGRAYGHEMWMREEIQPDLKAMTTAIHGEGGLASIQLGHCGFFAGKKVIGETPIGPSRKFCLFRFGFSRAAGEDDLEKILKDFTRAAVLSKEAGFDAVELHAGHGYLLSQFLSPWSNRRKDQYGGTLENRLRFPLQVIRNVRDAVGAAFPILVKMNVEDGFRGGLDLQEAKEVAKRFEAAGASALIPSCGFTAKTPLFMLRGEVPIREFVRNEKNPFLKVGFYLFGRLMVQRYTFNPLFLFDQAREIAEAVRIPVVLIGGICSLQEMNKAMDSGFEFVQVGRATIMEPQMVNKMIRGEIETVPCDHCNRCVGEMDAGGIRCVTLRENLTH
jgi:2,4-dienoyl-CoA reductase-like NADH-dependent reductase (Old Yellow Enzyme family)